MKMAKLYSEEQIAEANQVDLVEYLRSEGERFEKSGREWRWMRHDSITIRGNQWYRHKEQKGGYPIEFLKHFYSVSFKEAMKRLLAFRGQYPDATVFIDDYETKAFVKPRRADNNKKVIDYLIQKRFIDENVIHEFINRKLVYEDAEYHNVVFAGYDDNKVMKHAHKRSVYSNFRINVEGSLPEYSFYYEGNSDQLFVFEAPIDLLSYITLHPQDLKQHHYLALCGLSDKALLHRLNQNKTIQTVILCFDQDLAGQEAMSRLKELLQDLDYEVLIRKSEYKDWNEDLKAQHGMNVQERHVNERALSFEEHIHVLSMINKWETERTVSLKDVLGPFFHVLGYQKMSCRETSDYLVEMITACQSLISREDTFRYEYWPHKDKGSFDKRISRLRECIENLKQAYYQEENQDLLPKAYKKTVSECLHLHFELTQRKEQNKMNQHKSKPKAPLIGADGNIFNLMAIASKVLRRNNLTEEAKEMTNRITQGAQSYDEALMIIDEYVEIVSQAELEDEMKMSWED